MKHQQLMALGGDTLFKCSLFNCSLLKCLCVQSKTHWNEQELGNLPCSAQPLLGLTHSIFYLLHSEEVGLVFLKQLFEKQLYHGHNYFKK